MFYSATAQDYCFTLARKTTLYRLCWPIVEAYFKRRKIPVYFIYRLNKIHNMLSWFSVKRVHILS